MSCKPALFGGWGSCAEPMKFMVGGSLQKSGNTWTDATIQDLSARRLAIAGKTATDRNTLILPSNGFTPTTNEREVSESVLGMKYKTKNGIPSGTLFLDASICDYKQLHSLEGHRFLFFPSFDGGSEWATRKTDGTLKGFSCRVATQAGFKPDDATQSYPLDIYFDSYSEFENVVVIQQSFNFDDLFNYSPVALDVAITTAYTAGVVVVRVTKRGTGEGMTGLTEVTDWETMIVSFGTTLPAAVTVVAEIGQGAYTLTLKKDTGGTPANLAATDVLTLQAHEDDSTYLTYLSSAFDVVGGA